MSTDFAALANNIQTTVAIARTAGNPITVVTSVGFPTLSDSPPYDWVRLSVFRGTTPLCILNCSNISGNVLSIAGAIEGTTDTNLNVGDVISIDCTAGTLLDLSNALLSGGSQGAQGPQGSVGVQGQPGVQGSIGLQGQSGNTGSQGGSGPQGSIGAQGSTGLQGTVGVQGATGNQGPTGQQGAVGNQGFQGQLGVGVQGNTGASGSQGNQGSIGNQGLQGNQSVGLRPFTWQLAISNNASANLVVQTDATPWIVCSKAGNFVRWDAVCQTQPTGSSIILDVLLSTNGGSTFTSLWATNTSNKPSISASTSTGSGTSFDTTSFSAGNVLQLNVVQVGSTVPGSNVTLIIDAYMSF